MVTKAEGYYANQGRFCDRLRPDFENVDRLLKLGEWSATLGGEISIIATGKDSPECRAVASPIGAARGILCSVRWITMAEKIFTGKIFWSQDPKTGLFKRDKEGHKELRDPLDIITDVCLAVARFFTPVLFLNRVKAINIGEHAKWMGSVVIAMFTTITAISFGQAIAAMVNKTNNFIERLATLIVDFFDMLAWPWDNGMGFNTNPYLALAGAIVCTLSAGAYLLKSYVYYEGPSN